ncbi:LuxR C-terminal-related transcriptional regulator [Fulvivirga marina]|uniref:LuxR C-terminal-related transcriptional regulator n=1 Tax=Fulvivirga marina TaxID=2494733 RepID=UPI001EE288F6|nr:hypothetical protein [Fulvivirga marina]
MANTLDPMDIKQIITLHLDGLSNRKIGHTLGISRNTVNNYMKLINACDHSAEELLRFDHAELTELFPSQTTINNERFNELMLYFEKVNQARNHPGFTFLYHYDDYRQQSSLKSLTVIPSLWSTTGVSMPKQRVLLKLEHEPGKELLIDFCGTKLHITDKETGELIPVEVFVAILPNSQYTYVEASTTVEVYYYHERIALHPRNYSIGLYNTNKAI